MKLHEYQAKQLLAKYGMPVPKSVTIKAVGELEGAVEQLGGSFPVVVKAQVHAGGRGKAGGVKLVHSLEEAKEVAQSLLGTRLVTYQTDEQGQPVDQLLIEAPCDIEKELYLGALIDRSCQRLVIMASVEGGVDIEKVASETPEKILKIAIDPLVKLQAYQVRSLVFGLGLDKAQAKQLYQLLASLVKLFIECDISLLEINPLVITKGGDLICLDGKIILDDNALYRQPELVKMRDIRQEDEREQRAQQWELNYIALSGNIGCMVNGAGLAMATMDLIKLYGGEPANFLDVGGGATKERVTEAFKIIISDKQIQGVFVNIFGGIVRCDLIANGIIGAMEQVQLSVPVVVRLEGNRADIGAEKLAESGLNVIAVTGLAEAAERIVELVNGDK